jgi:hypothetical protein
LKLAIAKKPKIQINCFSRPFIGDVVEAPPYPGAKMCFLIEDKLDDPDWLCDLVEITVKELPEPKPKRKRKRKPKA